MFYFFEMEIVVFGMIFNWLMGYDLDWFMSMCVDFVVYYVFEMLVVGGIKEVLGLEFVFSVVVI